jgi:hypothetical protein
VKTITNKWLLISESHGDLNRYTPYRGKPDTHDTYAFYVSPLTSHARFLWAVHVHGNLSLVINNVRWTILLLRKMAPDIIPSTSADGSASLPPSFSPETTIEAVMKVKHLLTICYVSLLGP